MAKSQNGSRGLAQQEGQVGKSEPWAFVGEFIRTPNVPNAKVYTVLDTALAKEEWPEHGYSISGGVQRVKGFDGPVIIFDQLTSVDQKKITQRQAIAA